MSKKTFDKDIENFTYEDYDEKETEKKYIEMLESANQNKTDDDNYVDDNNLQDDNLKIDDTIEKSKKADEKEEAAERKFDKFTSE